MLPTKPPQCTPVSSFLVFKLERITHSVGDGELKFELSPEDEEKIVKSIDLAVTSAFDGSELQSESQKDLPNDQAASDTNRAPEVSEEMKGTQKMIDLMNRANFLRIKNPSYQYGFYKRRDDSGYVVIERFEKNHRFDLHKVWGSMQNDIAIDDNFNIAEWIKSVENVKDYRPYSEVYLVREYSIGGRPISVFMEYGDQSRRHFEQISPFKSKLELFKAKIERMHNLK